jgi:hypothetical protein
MAVFLTEDDDRGSLELGFRISLRYWRRGGIVKRHRLLRFISGLPLPVHSGGDNPVLLYYTDALPVCRSGPVCSDLLFGGGHDNEDESE